MLKVPAARKFPTELKEMKYEIEAHARGAGLDFFPVIFEVLDYTALNEVAAYGGFPQRYPHWTFGMQFDELSKGYAYGLSRIYEMVINNDPCYAYLLKCNKPVDQKLVMAHVYAHCDFFKNNLYFAHTNRKMMDEIGSHATRIQRYVDRFGAESVETFIDSCLSLENLIDPHGPFMASQAERAEGRPPAAGGEGPGPEPAAATGEDALAAHLLRDDPARGGSPDAEEARILPRRLRSKGYLDPYVNPPAFLRARAEQLRAKRLEQKRFPEAPTADVLLFLVEHAPLKSWQRDVLSMIREEAYYFVPQAQTKIMNEGWATYWHSRLMTEKILADGELIDYADHHAGTLGGSRLRLNPYKLGLELFRDIEERWYKGRFGRAYDECDDLAVRSDWDLQFSLGREKIFEVRRLYNDVTFIDAFFTEDFCRRHKLFLYAREEGRQAWVIQGREFAEIKRLILEGLANRGQPVIRTMDGNFENRGELLLAHQHEGRDLQWDFAKETLVNLHRLWQRPVHLMTRKSGTGVRLSFDGRDHRETSLGEYQAF